MEYFLESLGIIRQGPDDNCFWFFPFKAVSIAAFVITKSSSWSSSSTETNSAKKTV
jgi:hypothetical protein